MQQVEKKALLADSLILFFHWPMAGQAPAQASAQSPAQASAQAPAQASAQSPVVPVNNAF